MGLFDFFKKKGKNNNSISENNTESLSNDIDNALIEEIRQKLRKKAVLFQTGGIKPTHQIGESWIGNVCWQKSGESQPMCTNVNFPMAALATIFVPESDYVPKELAGIKMINIFVDDALWDNLDADDLSQYFVIRTYDSLDGLTACDYSDKETMLAFPLVPKYVENEFPCWEDVETESEEIEDIILKLENETGLDYYTDIFDNNEKVHKLGGYPSTIQSTIIFKEGCKFVMQISSDSKADINIVDRGNFYFGYNPTTKDWSVQCDFY